MFVKWVELVGVRGQYGLIEAINQKGKEDE
jgi:hypothetical protein